MIISLVFLLVALQTAPATDPHAGQLSEGTGRRCVSCHPKTPRAEDMYRAAARMEKMAADLSAGLLKRLGGITCFTCHQGSAKVIRIAARKRRKMSDLVSRGRQCEDQG